MWKRVKERERHTPSGSNTITPCSPRAPPLAGDDGTSALFESSTLRGEWKRAYY